MGRVVAPFGIHGEVKVQCFGDDPARLASIRKWWLQAGATPQLFDVEQARVQGRTVVARLVGVDDRDAAVGLKGREVAVPRADLPEPADGEFYWFELEGLSVVNRAGDRLGRIDSILDNGAHSVLVVRDGAVERLIPFVASVIDAVDRTGGQVSVDWGLDW
jgi:16S rRNA processing protein RimM